MHIDGKCHCGAIAYEAEVNPDTVVICHCAERPSAMRGPRRPRLRQPTRTIRRGKRAPMA
jgi:hypothetical protein